MPTRTKTRASDVVDVEHLLHVLDRLATYGVAVLGRAIVPTAKPAAKALRAGKAARVQAVHLTAALRRGGEERRARALDGIAPSELLDVEPDGTFTAPS